MNKLKLILAACALTLSSGLYAQQVPESGTSYYLYNVQTGQFLTRGNSWGTKAVTNEVGSPWQVTISNGQYTLRMLDIVSGGGTSGLGSNSFSDNGSPISFTPSGDANGYTLTNGSNVLVSPETYGGDVLAASGNSTWQFLNVNEYKAVLAAKTAAQEAAIATTAGISLGESTLSAIVGDENNWRHTDVSSAVPFPSNSSWTQTGVPSRGGYANQGSYGVERYEGGGTYSYTATGLAKGIYKVGIKAMFRSTSNAVCSTVGDAGYVNSSAYLSANGYVVQIKDWYSSRASATNPNSTGDFVTIANNGGYLSEVFAYVGDDGNLELKAVSESYWGGSWFLFNGITLTYYNNSVTDEDVAALIATIPSKVSTKQATALEAAKTALEANKTIANYNALSAAITAAQTSANEYAIIDAGVVPTSDVAGWAKSTTNGDLACNTWSTEGNSDGSGMTTPFIQDWVGSGTPLAGGNAGGKLYYEFTDLTPGETYVVTARVRVFNEAATGVTGATYFVGSSSKALETFGAACTGDYASKGKFAVLSCAGTVDAEGHLQFGIELAEDSPINWVSIKDVTIAAGTGDVPTAIELDKTSVALTTGSSIALTATITPNTADDKTVTWTSSDETVATVAGGTVVALKAGTATITATAYAGTNVATTATITVADGAAPSYYSTEIAAGDYYIMNVATGKFLGGANDWGTQASLIEHGIPFTAALKDGKYTLDSHTYNNANSHFFGGTYIDSGSTDLYITALGNGKFSISTAEGSAFVTAISGSTVVSNTAANTESSLAQWYFLSKNDRDKMLAAATSENPVDATYYVKQADISRNLSAGAHNVNAWSQYNVGGTQNNSNFAAQVYNAAVDNYQTIENIPNGTYKVSVQAFTSGTDVKFYANDQKVDVKNNDSGASSCSAAAALFAQGLYPNEVTVTVTNRTLKIGFEGDCSSSKWLCYDKVEVFMTNYDPVTEIAATIDKTDIEIGKTATISDITVTPKTASFNAYTITSSDETIATVSEAGVVTGVAEGEATITIKAEMENVSKTFDINVVAPAVLPTSVELNETEIALTATANTATLTAIVGEEGAPQTVVWTSSNEAVATVAEGVVTGVLPGTTTIRATALGYDDVYAEATVTVTYPESTVPTTTYVNEGATRTVYTLGENLIKNGSFEYANPVYGWTTGTGSVNAMSTDNFNIVTEGAADGNQYLQAKESKSGADAKSINTSWPLEDGKTYVFGYKIKANKQCTTDLGYIGTSLSNTKGSENSSKKFETPAYGTEWQDVTYTFTNTDNYKWLVFNARWMANAQSFDNFYLAEATYTIVGNVDYAKAAIPTANIGTGAFQYSQDAIDAANALVQGEATVPDVEAAYEALTTLNAPEEDKLYNIIVAEENNAKNGNAVVITTGATSANNPTGYSLNVNLAPNTNLNQAVTFTKVSGNNYNISFETAAGTTYLTTGSLNGSAAGWKTQQIQATTDAEKKCAFTIVASTEDNVFYIYNPQHKDYIDYQDGGSLYTDTDIDHKSFSLVETTKPSIPINTTAAGWGTVMLPFAVASLPKDVNAYTCAAIGDNNVTLTLEQVYALEANKPYIIEGPWNETLTGDAQGTALTYTEGLLTGTYSTISAPNGSYILQKHGEKVGFYKVDKVDIEEAKPYVPANHAYLTYTDGGQSRAAFFFPEGGTTGIAALKALTEGDAQIFDASGRAQQRLVKGLNIVVLKNGQTQKIVVK